MLPVLAEGVEGDVTSRSFDDLDLVVVDGSSVPVKAGMPWWYALLAILLIGLGVLVVVAILRGRSDESGAADEIDELLPARDTPLGAIAALRRIDQLHGDRLGAEREILRADIRDLEQAYFSPAASGGANGQARSVVDRWVATVRSAN
ncbi:MAG: hypothetical protein MK085_07265, partial [Phycisphaerales bacterium]|nr:hypothetical protein [Phycisphaerales bacterium]